MDGAPHIRGLVWTPGTREVRDTLCLIDRNTINEQLDFALWFIGDYRPNKQCSGFLRLEYNIQKSQNGK